MSATSVRLSACFEALRPHHAAFISFVTAGDPDLETSLALIQGLPEAGVDIIELGMPFTDPMADGPVIQAASQRALAAGASMERTLGMVRTFRKGNNKTPIVLMGYCNPIHAYGVDRFARDAADAGVDGLIIVDLPPEEDGEWRGIIQAVGIDLIRLVTPTTDEARLKVVLRGIGGFIYYVAVSGVTGTMEASVEDIEAAVTSLTHHTDLPVAVGFGVKTPEQACAVARVADGVVVGSAIVEVLRSSLDNKGRAGEKTLSSVLSFTGELADSIHQVHK
ncbi:MAG: tryptophan synthase subunit alpha [Parvularculales bacterium]